MPEIFGKEISATTLGLLGAGVGGILGASGSKGQTSGTQGYAGGIPDYTATRSLVPNAFDPTGRRPGEAGRRYFTDVDFTRGADNAILGGAELDALNAANLAQQKEFDAAGAELLGIASLNQQEQAAGNAGAGTGIAAGVVPAAGAGVVPAADGNGVVSNSVLDGFGEVVDDGYGYAGAADTVDAFNSFISPFYNQEQLTSAQLIQLGDSGYDLATIASTLNVDATALSNAITQARTTTAAAAVVDGGDDTVVDDTVVDDTVVDDTVVDETDAAFNSFISPFYNQEQLTSAQLIQLGDSGYDLATIASKLGVDATALSNAIAQATSAAQTQSIFDAVDPSDGFSDTEAASIANLILGGQIDIEGVANQFEGVSDMDVIEGMLRGGYETPAAMTERLTPANTGLTEVELMASLLSQGRTTPEELAAYYGNNPDYPEYAGVTAAEVRGFAKELGIEGYAQGGNVNGYYLGGTTDGMADNVPATIDNMQPAALSDGEFVIPADVVSHLGNGNSDSGAQNLYSMMERVRTDRTGNPNQGKQIDPNQYLA